MRGLGRDVINAVLHHALDLGIIVASCVYEVGLLYICAHVCVSM